MPTGSVTQANMRLSIINGTAFCDFSSASVLTDYLGYRLEVSDSAGKKLIGYIKAAGTGETYGSELIVNPTFDSNTSYWYLFGASAFDSVAGGQTNNYGRMTLATAQTLDLAVSLTSSFGTDVLTSLGGLYKTSCYMKNENATAGALSIECQDFGTLNSSFEVATSWALTNVYATLRSSNNHYVGLGIFGSAGQKFGFDDVSAKQVTAPSSTGVTIVSAANGSTYNWISEESGFNRNDSSGYTYLIQKSLPVFTNQYRFRRS